METDQLLWALSDIIFKEPLTRPHTPCMVLSGSCSRTEFHKDCLTSIRCCSEPLLELVRTGRIQIFIPWGGTAFREIQDGFEGKNRYLRQSQRVAAKAGRDLGVAVWHSCRREAPPVPPRSLRSSSPILSHQVAPDLLHVGTAWAAVSLVALRRASSLRRRGAFPLNIATALDWQPYWFDWFDQASSFCDTWEVTDVWYSELALWH